MLTVAGAAMVFVQPLCAMTAFAAVALLRVHSWATRTQPDPNSVLEVRCACGMYVLVFDWSRLSGIQPRRAIAFGMG